MLEGGGQILRNAAALAAILGVSVRIENIRAKRSKPGLRPQHLTGLRMIERASHGRLEGGTVNSTQVILHPGVIECAEVAGDTGTAGSCVLLAQTAIPCLLFAKSTERSDLKGYSTLSLRGGTDATLAPPVGYMQHVLLPLLEQCAGISVELTLLRRGFFPRGGGQIEMKIPAITHGNCIPAIQLMEFGRISRVNISSFTAGRVHQTVGERMVAAAERDLRYHIGENVEFNLELVHEPSDRAVGDGCGILIVVETTSGCRFGGTGIGERGVPAETVGRNAAAGLLRTFRESPSACVDMWMQDQLIIFMALAKGKSMIRMGEPSLHTRTAMAVVEALTSVRFEIQREEKTWVVSCIGMGIEGRESL